MGMAKPTTTPSGQFYIEDFRLIYKINFKIIMPVRKQVIRAVNPQDEL